MRTLIITISYVRLVNLTGEYEMKKIAILITDDISAFHLSVPLAIFADIIPDHSLFNVVLCSVQGKTIKTSHGMHITPEYDLSVLRTADSHS